VDRSVRGRATAGRSLGGHPRPFAGVGRLRRDAGDRRRRPRRPGCRAGGGSRQLAADGATTISDVAAYAPGDRRWRRLADAPFPVSAENTSATWTGRQLFLLTVHGAALLDPSTGQRRQIAAPPIPHADPNVRRTPAVVWNGRQVVGVDVVQATDGTSNTLWRPTIRQRTAGPELWSHSITHTIRGGTMASGTAGVDVLRLTSDGKWTTLAAGWPQDKTVSAPLLTDVGIVVPAGQIWCGNCSHPAPFNGHGYLADPHPPGADHHPRPARRHRPSTDLDRPSPRHHRPGSDQRPRCRHRPERPRRLGSGHRPLGPRRPFPWWTGLAEHPSLGRSPPVRHR
jgi:hypothetical protein